jgi:hypothetical protein
MRLIHIAIKLHRSRSWLNIIKLLFSCAIGNHDWRFDDEKYCFICGEGLENRGFTNEKEEA